MVFMEQLLTKVRVLTSGSEALNHILPRMCLICDEMMWQCGVKSFVCNECFGKLRFITNAACIKCNKQIEFQTLTNTCCEECELNKWSYDSLISCVYYDDISAKIAMKLKYQGRGARFISQIMLQKCISYINNIDYVLSVPLHETRLIKRGFNQSDLIAQCFSSQSGIAFLPALKREKYTQSQGGLTKKERMENVRDVFCVPEEWRRYLQGKRILLIDDVMTTGATVNSLACTLKSIGVKHISVGVWAKRDINNDFKTHI